MLQQLSYAIMYVHGSALLAEEYSEYVALN